MISFLHIFHHYVRWKGLCDLSTLIQTVKHDNIYLIWCHVFILFMLWNHIGGVMVSVLASSAVDRGFEPRSGQTKNYKISICCFSVKSAAVKKKSKDWLAWNRNNVPNWNEMCTRGLLFQWASTTEIKLSVLV